MIEQNERLILNYSGFHNFLTCNQNRFYLDNVYVNLQRKHCPNRISTGLKPIPNSLENVKNPCGYNIFLRLRLIVGKRWKTRLFGLEICVSPNSLENGKNPCATTQKPKLRFYTIFCACPLRKPQAIFRTELS